MRLLCKRTTALRSSTNCAREAQDPRRNQKRSRASHKRCHPRNQTHICSAFSSMIISNMPSTHPSVPPLSQCAGPRFLFRFFFFIASLLSGRGVLCSTVRWCFVATNPVFIIIIVAGRACSCVAISLRDFFISRSLSLSVVRVCTCVPESD